MILKFPPERTLAPMAAAFAGIDGCPGGWVAVRCDERMANVQARFAEELVQLLEGVRVAAVDIPIGLPDRGQREADRAARKALGRPRGSSVFSCPVRSVLGASSWEEACALSQLADGRRMSKQAFGIVDKIDEVDRLIRSQEWARQIVREVHPELSFARWAGHPMKHRKKSRDGREERRRLIAAAFGDDAFARAKEAVRGNDVASDDIADAFAAAWTAVRIARRTAESFPAQVNRDVSRDAIGIPMTIWA
jgi:predicted RNase H-like nuclease